ncbi:MAG: hypothetical protein EXX96DRAFT_476819 [Benjaminiella poitrasii]|nr:MAG: hypothetical protein EXX96DRAFT_476819 [Benjaminiella poitrasii]
MEDNEKQEEEDDFEEEEEEEDDDLNSLNNGNADPTRRQWLCHTKVLFNESPYFASLFGENFSESQASVVYLPSSIIDGLAFDNILEYMYTQQIHKPKKLKDLCEMYCAADYLGMDKLCMQLTKLVIETIHNCTCYCTQCQYNVPELFPFCRTRAVELQDEKMAVMTQKVITILANDPEKTLSTFWTSRHMAGLLTQLPPDVSQALSQKVLHRVNKSNAIESLHACFTASNTLSTKDPLLSWAKPLHATLTSVQSRATKIIARHFDFFCREYPALLSCIDGITYSFDFLEYLLLHILEDQMDCSNVGMLYQGIVCDLMSRHAVQYIDQVKHILTVAKVMILHYITRRIGDIRQQGGLDKLEKSVLRQLANDLEVRPNAPMIGMHRRVQLIRRPALTVGTVAYVGHVNFAEGIWIGVELDRRVGKNDGSVDGYRYFASSPNRGVFVRPEDVALVV